MPREPDGSESPRHLKHCAHACCATFVLLVSGLYPHDPTGELVTVLDAEYAAHGRGPRHSARTGRDIVRSAQHPGLEPFAVPAGEHRMDPAEEA